MWPQPREGTGSATVIGNFTFHPLLLSGPGIKKLQLDEGFEPKPISALLWAVSPGNMHWERAAGLGGRCQGDLGIVVICPDPHQSLGTQQAALQTSVALEFNFLKFPPLYL